MRKGLLQKISISLVALIISIAYILAVGSSQAYAATTVTSPPVIWHECFTISQTVKVTGTNTFAVHGTVVYDCNIVRQGGGITVTPQLNCPVQDVKTDMQPSFLAFQGSYAQGHTWTYLVNYTAHCEACVNHVPVAFPFFTVDVRTGAASAIESGWNGGAIGNSANGHIGLFNSPAYTFPC